MASPSCRRTASRPTSNMGSGHCSHPTSRQVFPLQITSPRHFLTFLCLQHPFNPLPTLSVELLKRMLLDILCFTYKANVSGLKPVLKCQIYWHGDRQTLLTDKELTDLMALSLAADRCVKNAIEGKWEDNSEDDMIKIWNMVVSPLTSVDDTVIAYILQHIALYHYHGCQITRQRLSFPWLFWSPLLGFFRSRGLRASEVVDGDDRLVRYIFPDQAIRDYLSGGRSELMKSLGAHRSGGGRMFLKPGMVDFVELVRRISDRMGKRRTKRWTEDIDISAYPVPKQAQQRTQQQQHTQRSDAT